MRRAVALLLVAALLGVSSLVASLHTHLYSDHDHAEHHHGPAAHEHHSMPLHRGHARPAIERCDPGQHAVAFTFITETPQPLHAIHAGIVASHLVVEPVGRTERGMSPRDVRVHGPPHFTRSTPRAPPLFVLA